MVTTISIDSSEHHFGNLTNLGSSALDTSCISKYGIIPRLPTEFPSNVQYCSLIILQLVRITFVENVANLDVIFRGEGAEITNNCMQLPGKNNSKDVRISKQIFWFPRYTPLKKHHINFCQFLYIFLHNWHTYLTPFSCNYQFQVISHLR